LDKKLNCQIADLSSNEAASIICTRIVSYEPCSQMQHESALVTDFFISGKDRVIWSRHLYILIFT